MYSEDYILKVLSENIEYVTSINMEEIKLDTKMVDLDLDSIDSSELEIEIEESFNIEIDVNIEEFETVNDLVKYIKEKTGE